MRLTTTLRAVVEENPESWRAERDDLYLGVRQGLDNTATRLRYQGDVMDRHVCALDTNDAR